MLFGGGIANAQVSQQIKSVNQTQINELLNRIDLLNRIIALLRQIESLKVRIAELQAQQSSAPVVQQPVINEVVNQAPKLEAPSAPVVPAPQKQYNPLIKLEIIGTKVFWHASGEPFKCKLNGQDVHFEGNKETNGATNYTLTCVGSETGTKLEKSIQ